MTSLPNKTNRITVLEDDQGMMDISESVPIEPDDDLNVAEDLWTKKVISSSVAFTR